MTAAPFVPRRVLRLGVGLALATAGLAAPASARAEPGSARSSEAAEAERLGEEARVLFEEGRFAEAVGRYLKAWHVSGTASLLYNVAFIYDRKLGEKELALEYYRRYAKAPDADPDVLQRALARVDALKAEIEAAGRTPPADPGGEPGPLGRGDDGAVGSSGTAGAGTGSGVGNVRMRSEEPEPRRLPWILLGTGGALLAGGIVTGTIASGTKDEFDRSHDLAEKKGLREDGEMQTLVADVLLVTGILAVGAGVAVGFLGGVGEDTATSRPRFEVGLVPSASGAPLLRLGGSF